MVATDKLFAGSIPEIYDRFLVPLIFDSYARDLADRLAKIHPQDLLETAAGTGALSRAIASRLPAQVPIVATDLNQPMLDRAAAHDPMNGRINWRQADALALPFADQSFDAVACQFGVMFFPTGPRLQGGATRLEARWQLPVQRLGSHFRERFCRCCVTGFGRVVPTGSAVIHGPDSAWLSRRGCHQQRAATSRIPVGHNRER